MAAQPSCEVRASQSQVRTSAMLFDKADVFATAVSTTVGIIQNAQLYVWREGYPEPEPVSELQAQAVKQAAFGRDFALVLTHDGRLFSWGANHYHQLGRPTQTLEDGRVQLRDDRPRRIKGLGVRVVAIACGASHAFAVTEAGDVLGWGRNHKGQLGTGPCPMGVVEDPRPVATPYAVPITQVACGDHHSLFLDVFGGVWASGAAEYGATGTGNPRNDIFPSPVALGSQQVVAVTCGAHFSAAVTASGALLTWGRSNAYQTGHGNTATKIRPTLVSQLARHTIVDAHAGGDFLLATDAAGTVWGMGSNATGALFSGAREEEYPHAITVTGWHRVHVARTHSILVPTEAAPVALSLATNTRLPTCPAHLQGIGWETLTAVLADTHNARSLGALERQIGRVFSCPVRLNTSFLDPETHRLSIPRVLAFAEAVRALPHEHGGALLTTALTGAALSLARACRVPVSVAPAAAINFLHVLLLVFDSAQVRANPVRCADALTHVLGVIATHSPAHIQDAFLDTLFSEYPVEARVSLFEVLQILFERLHTPNKASPALWAVIDMMLLVAPRADDHLLSLLQCPSIDNLDVVWSHFALFWNATKKGQALGPRAYCWFRFPWVVPVHLKIGALARESAQRQQYATAQLVQRTLARGRPPPPLLALNVHVDRADVFGSARRSLFQQMDHLQAPLRVHFDGEEGVDEGGPRREFFHVVLDSIVAAHGLLVVPDVQVGVNRLASFDEYRATQQARVDTDTEPAMDPEDAYEAFLDDAEILGVIIGLALLNRALLYLPLPSVVFRALALGVRCPLDTAIDLSALPLSLEDVGQVDGVLRRSLEAILEWSPEPDTESGWEDRAFHEAMPLFMEDPDGSGAMVPVPLADRSAYVAQVLSSTLLTPQLVRLAEGFRKTTHGLLLPQCMTPTELSACICGEEEFDVDALRAAAHYTGGYHALHPIIVAFWEMVAAMDADTQKRFLWFVAGSDRVPVGGLGRVVVTIDRAAPGDPGELRLPSAHVCHRYLVLPEYRTPEDMQRAFDVALGESAGFLLV